MSDGERFERIARIGAGATGTVWRAYDRRLGRACAVKLVRAPDPRTLVRVVLEQTVRLDHPHLLCPYAWQADDDGTLLATELMTGGSLDTLLRDNGPLPWRYAAEILTQVTSGLAAVHAAGLVHRDVKPANVLLAATGTGPPYARLGDFGIAYPAGGPRLTETGFVVGTPGYVAPEVLAGAPPAPPQDLYALGFVGRQLLTGADLPEDATGCPDTPVTPLLDALVAGDPTGRPDAARAAAELAALCSATPLDVPAYAADGEPVEVFDQVTGADPADPPTPRDPAPPPLVSANRTSGSDRDRGDRAAVPTAGSDRDPADRATGPGSRGQIAVPTGREVPGSRITGPDPGRPATAAAGGEARDGRTAGPPTGTGRDPGGTGQRLDGAGPSPGEAGQGPGGAGPPSVPAPPSSRRVALLVVLAVVAVAAGGVAAVAAGSSGGTPGPTGSPPAPAASGARAGAPCDWQDVGIATPGPDGGTLRCTYRGGRYSWR